MADRCYLGGYELPPQFSYPMPEIKKRRSVFQTSGAVITQSSDPVIVDGDSTISWTCRNVTPQEYRIIRNIFEDPDELEDIIFSGYWGDSYRVYFMELDPVPVRRKIWNMSGLFQIIEVLSKPVPYCEP